MYTVTISLGNRYTDCIELSVIKRLHINVKILQDFDWIIFLENSI